MMIETLELAGKGKVETTLTDEQAREACAKMNSNFANDLARKAARYTPSYSQRFWMHKLAMQAQTPVAVGSFAGEALTGIVELFSAALSNGMKRPRVSFVDPNTEKRVTIKRMGPLSRFPNSLTIAQGKYGEADHKYFGRIMEDGSLVAGRDMTTEMVNTLRAISENPSSTLAVMGRQTGECMFCAKELTDGRSVTVGYGPICAGHYNLPWGEEKGVRE